ncbi:MAG: hypothetical protein ACI4XC_01045 [Eubacterium sp.]
MENKIKDVFEYFKKNDSKKIKIIIAVGLIGVILIAMSDIFADSGKDSKAVTSDNISYSDYTNELEDKLCNIISSIDGVGECKVMITLENSKENVYATDNENKTDSDSASSKDEYVIYDSDNGETPVLIKEYYPKIQGVSVVCSGGDSIVVKEQIINTVTSLFNISTNRVSVSKIKE